MAAEQNEIPSKQAAVRLVSVGRLHPAKGTDALLYALKEVRKQSANLECYILGDGPERQRLIELAGDLGLNKSVFFTGYVENPYGWLQTADIFVSPSRWETFGIAIAEAMALGLSVVATATDGANDIITDKVDGLLVPVGNAHALAEAVIDLLNKPGLRQKLGTQAKLGAQQFNAPLIAQRYMMVLERLLAERSRHG
jgi:glycosyltransferase involved in cell wall biosynthesis